MHRLPVGCNLDTRTLIVIDGNCVYVVYNNMNLLSCDSSLTVDWKRTDRFLFCWAYVSETSTSRAAVFRKRRTGMKSSVHIFILGEAQHYWSMLTSFRRTDIYSVKSDGASPPTHSRADRMAMFNCCKNDFPHEYRILKLNRISCLDVQLVQGHDNGGVGGAT